MNEGSMVYVVDDDDALQDSIDALLAVHGFQSQHFISAQHFLDHLPSSKSGCALIDINMPGMSGIELLEKLKQRQFKLPCIMITGFAQISTAVRAMKDGAFDFIEKPFESEQLISCVRRAIEQCGIKAVREEGDNKILDKVSKLTPRERDVMVHMAQGQPNKIIAYQLGISPRTVEVHRARLMEKLSAGSLADVVRVAIDARLIN